jgi:hypothetical protein
MGGAQKLRSSLRIQGCFPRPAIQQPAIVPAPRRREHSMPQAQFGLATFLPCVRDDEQSMWLVVGPAATATWLEGYEGIPYFKGFLKGGDGSLVGLAKLRLEGFKRVTDAPESAGHQPWTPSPPTFVVEGKFSCLVTLVGFRSSRTRSPNESSPARNAKMGGVQSASVAFAAAASLPSPSCDGQL